MSQVIPKADKFTKVTIDGTWIKNKDGYFWKEEYFCTVWDSEFRTFIKEPTARAIVLKTPIEFGLTRIAEISVLFCKDYANRDVPNGFERTWFKQVMKYSLNSSMADNVWLFPYEGKLFCKSIDPDYGVCLEVGLGESNENYTCTKLKPEKVTPEQALEIVKQTHTKYIFTKVEGDNFITVV